MNPDDYRDSQGKEYVPPNRMGYCDIGVLPELTGRPWDQLALNFVHGLRPSYLRVVRGEETTDAIPWRVTVYLDKGNRIERISQEVETGCVGANHGADLMAQLHGKRVPGGPRFLMQEPPGEIG